MKLRTVNKMISATLAVVMTIGTLVMASPAKVRADENENSNPYIDTEYGEILGNSCKYNYMRDGVLVTNNAGDRAKKDSYTPMINDSYRNKLELTKESELIALDDKGHKYTLKNIDSNNNKKYDYVYTLTRSSYYFVEKSDKIACISKNGSIKKMGETEWYDYIEAYNMQDYYGLYTKNSDGTYSYQYVDKNGNILYENDSVTNYSMEYVSDKYKNIVYSLYKSYVILPEKDGNIVVIDKYGKEWYHGKECVDCRMNDKVSSSDAPYLILNFGDSYIYINYENDKKVTANESLIGNVGICSSNGANISYYDGDYTLKYKTISVYTDVTSVKITGNKIKYLMYSTADGLSNIYDENGNKWLDNDADIKTFSNNKYKNEGLIYTIQQRDGTAKEMFCSNEGNVKKTLAEIKDIADKAFYNNMGNVTITDENYELLGAGMLFKYKIADSDTQYEVIVTKESNYTDTVIIIGKDDYVYEKYSNIYFKHNKVDVKIPIPDSTSNGKTQMSYQLNTVYVFTDDNLEVLTPPEPLYIYDMGNIYYTSMDYSDWYFNRSTYEFVKIENTEKVEEKIPVGNKGAYYVKRNGRYIFYGNEGQGLYIGADIGYDFYNITDLTLFKQCLDIGYIGYEYHYKSDGKMKYVYEVYSCDGKELYSYTSDEYTAPLRCGGRYNYDSGFIMTTEEGTAVWFRNPDKKVLDDVISQNSSIKIEAKDGIEQSLVTGIKSDNNVKDIRSMFNNSLISIVDEEGNVLDDTFIVGTGCVIQLMNGDNVNDSAVVMIKGDTDGTGTIDVLDMETIQKSILGIGDSLSGVYKEAALLNGDNTDEVTVLDMEVIQKDILGIEKINN